MIFCTVCIHRLVHFQQMQSGLYSKGYMTITPITLEMPLNILTSFRFGPLIRHWTMRYEAKHSYFKRLAQVLGKCSYNVSMSILMIANPPGNFINLPYSLAMRHQQLQCHLRVSSSTCVDRNVGKGMYRWYTTGV